jgi:hypothetical protein
VVMRGVAGISGEQCNGPVTLSEPSQPHNHPCLQVAMCMLDCMLGRQQHAFEHSQLKRTPLLALEGWTSTTTATTTTNTNYNNNNNNNGCCCCCCCFA